MSSSLELWVPLSACFSLPAVVKGGSGRQASISTLAPSVLFPLVCMCAFSVTCVWCNLYV